MANDMRDKGIEIANDAVSLDQGAQCITWCSAGLSYLLVCSMHLSAGNYEDAVAKYILAADYFLHALK